MKRDSITLNKGITLIALVITIIVLLILAGVTIATLMGDNGILTKATEAKNDQADGTVKEAVALLWNEYQLEIKSSSNEGVKESTKIASTEITKIQGEEANYLATTATSFWDFLLTDKQVINGDGIVDVQKLTGQTLDRGNGTDGVTDVYKIERDEETNEYTLKYCIKAGDEESIWNITEKMDSQETDNVLNLTIKDATYFGLGDFIIEYESGMTWREWIGSDYNDELLEIRTGYNGDAIDLTNKMKDKAGYEYFMLCKEDSSEALPDELIDLNLMYSIIALPN